MPPSSCCQGQHAGAPCQRASQLPDRKALRRCLPCLATPSSLSPGGERLGIVHQDTERDQRPALLLRLAPGRARHDSCAHRYADRQEQRPLERGPGRRCVRTTASRDHQQRADDGDRLERRLRHHPKRTRAVPNPGASPSPPSYFRIKPGPYSVSHVRWGGSVVLGWRSCQLRRRRSCRTPSGQSPNCWDDKVCQELSRCLCFAERPHLARSCVTAASKKDLAASSPKLSTIRRRSVFSSTPKSQ